MVQTVLLAQDKRLVERLRALRHLPPSTSLPQISSKEDQQLLQDLLQLSDEIDVLSWLHHNLERNVAKIALRIALGQIATMCRDIHAASSRIEIPNYYQQMFGGLLELTEDTLPIRQLDNLEENDSSEDLLRQVLRQLQSVYQKSPTQSLSFQARDEREQVLADLLRLPQDEDSLSWLEKTHAVFATRLVLSHLLARFSVTHGSLTTLPTVRTIKVRKHFRPFAAVDVEIEHLTLKPTGFLVQACVTISPRRLPLPENTVPSSFIWSGFERVVDNFGSHYLTWVENLRSGGTHFHRYQEQLTMAFYPAVAENNSRLAFSSQPMLLEARTVSPAGRLLPLPDMAGENLLWQVSL